MIPNTSEEDSPTIRTQHTQFTIKVFGVGMGFLVFAIGQWVAASFRDGISTNEQYFLTLPMLGLSFMMMLGFAFFFEYFNQTSKMLTYACVFITVESATFVLVRPVMQASLIDYICCTTLTAILLLITVIMALPKVREMDYTPSDLILWTMRFYLLTVLGILLSTTTRSIHLQTFLSTTFDIMLFFVNLSFGRMIGNQKFYRIEAPNAVLYAVLIYYNFASFYGNALLFSQNIRYFIRRYV